MVLQVVLAVEHLLAEGALMSLLLGVRGHVSGWRKRVPDGHYRVFGAVGSNSAFTLGACSLLFLLLCKFTSDGPEKVQHFK